MPSPAPNKNIPNSLKVSFRGWPISAVTFDDLLVRAVACPDGLVAVDRFSKPKHTAYLVDRTARTLYRCVQLQPMRVQLRRALKGCSGVRLLASEAAG